MQKIASYLEDVRDPEVKRMHRFGSFGKIWKYKKVLYDGIFIEIYNISSPTVQDQVDKNAEKRGKMFKQDLVITRDIIFGAPNSCLMTATTTRRNFHTSQIIKVSYTLLLFTLINWQ